MAEELAPLRPEASADNLQAALLVTVACAFFAGMGALAKTVNAVPDAPTVHPLQIAAARFTFGLLFLLPVAAAARALSFATTVPLRHVGRVVCGVGGISFMFLAVMFIPLAEATAISFSSPLFTMLFAAVFLREIVTGRRWAAAIAGFVGILVILRPGSAAFDTASLFALVAAAFIGAEVAIIRGLARRDPPLTILLWSNALGAVLSLAAAAPVWVWPQGMQWWPLVAVGIVTVSGQLLFVRAARLGDASFVAPFFYATILFSVTYGALFFGETPGWPFYAGAVLLVAAGVYLNFDPGSRRTEKS